MRDRNTRAAGATRQIGSREECETLGRGKKKQLDIWRLLPPSLQSEVGGGKLLTEGDRWSDSVDEALEQSEQQVCKHVIFREREEERGGIMFSYIVRHMNRDNTVLQVVWKTDD